MFAAHFVYTPQFLPDSKSLMQHKSTHFKAVDRLRQLASNYPQGLIAQQFFKIRSRFANFCSCVDERHLSKLPPAKTPHGYTNNGCK